MSQGRGLGQWVEPEEAGRGLAAEGLDAGVRQRSG